MNRSGRWKSDAGEVWRPTGNADWSYCGQPGYIGTGDPRGGMQNAHQNSSPKGQTRMESSIPHWSSRHKGPLMTLPLLDSEYFKMAERFSTDILVRSNRRLLGQKAREIPSTDRSSGVGVTECSLLPQQLLKSKEKKSLRKHCLHLNQGEI